jgi:hypothetical protein
MFAWFQRSAHARSACATDVVCPEPADGSAPANRRPKRALRHKPVRREVAAVVFASEVTVARFAVDRRADRGLEQTDGVDRAGARPGNAGNNRTKSGEEIAT